MTCMFGIMQVIGIINYPLNVAFVITNLHPRFKDVISLHYYVSVLSRQYKQWLCLIGNALQYT